MIMPSETARPLSAEELDGIRGGWWRDQANRGWLAVGYVDRLIATLDVAIEAKAAIPRLWT